MKKRITHIAPLIFLIFLLLPILSAILLQSTQWCLKAKAKDWLEKEQLITITLPTAVVQWEKMGKELRIDGRLFDVKQFTVRGDALTTTGYFDEAENVIERLLSFLPPTKDHSNLLQLLLIWQCLPVMISRFSLCIIARSSTKLHRHYPLFLPCPDKGSTRKPPQN